MENPEQFQPSKPFQSSEQIQNSNPPAAAEHHTTTPASTEHQTATPSESLYKLWPHTPSHLFVPNTAYMITCGTDKKVHYLAPAHRRDLVLKTIFEQAERFNWKLEAWAVLANHYHIIATAPANPKTLPLMLRSIHSKTAIAINKEDHVTGRQVWYQYRDTCLTMQASYLARLHYVHTNPQRHRVVARAEDYPWCSMRWFLIQANAAFRKTVLDFPCDQVNVPDDF